MYLTDDAQKSETHKGTKPSSIFPTVTPLPNYVFEFGDLQLFQEQITKTFDENSLKTEVKYVTESNAWGELLLSLLPFVLIIGRDALIASIIEIGKPSFLLIKT
mgnify:CR=1 FL=1